MKNFLVKAKQFCMATISRMKTVINGVKTAVVCRAKAVLVCGRGESFVDTAVKILIAIIIGALVLSGLYLLFSGTILPTLTQRIQDMFNYSGS